MRWQLRDVRSKRERTDTGGWRLLGSSLHFSSWYPGTGSECFGVVMPSQGDSQFCYMEDVVIFTSHKMSKCVIAMIDDGCEKQMKMDATPHRFADRLRRFPATIHPAQWDEITNYIIATSLRGKVYSRSSNLSFVAELCCNMVCSHLVSANSES